MLAVNKVTNVNRGTNRLPHNKNIDRTDEMVIYVFLPMSDSIYKCVLNLPLDLPSIRH